MHGKETGWYSEQLSILISAASVKTFEAVPHLSIALANCGQVKTFFFIRAPNAGSSGEDLIKRSPDLECVYKFLDKSILCISSMNPFKVLKYLGMSPASKI